jgi:anaerobic selenocysteine-containing dehydrogenase
MTSTLSRRNFLKLAALSTGAGACVPVSQQLASRLEAYNQPPEELLSGTATWYTSTCRQCPAGCGIVVRTINGRAKKIEGNPYHPLNEGKLCARGQAGLQALYNPDRLRNAVEQTGGRGSRHFEPLYWDSALERLLQMLQSIQPTRIAFLGGSMPDHLYLLVKGWLEAMGVPPMVRFNLQTMFDGRHTTEKAAETLFGSGQLPVYDIANSDVIFSFGANLLETWQSPVAYGRNFGEFRQGQAGGRGFFVQFEPRLSATAASADEWIPLQPGSDGLVALALGRIIIEQGLGKVGAFGQEEANLYRDVDVGAIAETSDVSVEALERLANIVASADRPVAIPGGYPLGQQNGYAAFQDIQGLNLILRRFGQSGGVYLSHPSPAETLPGSPAPDSFQSIQELIDRMNGGEVDLLLLHGVNPVYELPSSAGIAEAVAKVPYVVSFNTFIDETAIYADLILPDHTYLESWGYQVASPSADRPAVSNQQPVVQPLYDTRATSDVILTLAAEMGGAVAEALPWASEVLFLEDSSGALLGSSLSPYNVKTAGEFWAAWRQNGGWWSERELLFEPEPIGFFGQPLPTDAPSFHGDPEQYPFHLYPYSGVGLGDGSLANLPWLQELPDPMTTASWQTWVEINPETADMLGVEDNDVVKVVSQEGQIEAIVVVYPGIRPDMIAIPVGQGHENYGRYTKGRGSSPLDLLTPVKDPQTGTLAWGATRVRIETTGRKYLLPRLESLDGEGRETLR